MLVAVANVRKAALLGELNLDSCMQAYVPHRTEQRSLRRLKSR